MRIGLRSGVMLVGLGLFGGPIPQVSAQAPTKTDTGAPLPGANSFVESQARKRIEDSGFTDVSPLVNDSLGIWTGTAKNGTGKVRVSVDYKGNVSAVPE